MSKKISEDVKNAIDRAIDINVKMEEHFLYLLNNLDKLSKKEATDIIKKMEDLCVEVELMSKKYSDETSIFSYNSSTTNLLLSL